MGEAQLQNNAKIYTTTTDALSRGVNEESEGMRNMRPHRRLCHATCDSDLNKFYKVGDATKNHKELNS